MTGLRRVSDQMLCEYVDGGLPRLNRLRIAILLRVDPRLARRAESIRHHNNCLQKIAGSVFLEPIPEQMATLLARAALDAEDWTNPGISWQTELGWLLLALAATAGCVGLWAF